MADGKCDDEKANIFLVNKTKEINNAANNLTDSVKAINSLNSLDKGFEKMQQHNCTIDPKVQEAACKAVEGLPKALRAIANEELDKDNISNAQHLIAGIKQAEYSRELSGICR